jgi:hypothetical protein
MFKTVCQKLKFKGCIALIVCLSSEPTLSETTIYALEIPGLHQPDGKGTYDQMIRTSLVEKGLATLKLLPPARAESLFSNCTNCCLSPGNDNPEFYDWGQDIQVTEPMAVAKVIIFSPPNMPVISELTSLEGSLIGIRSGMPYGKSFDLANLITQSTLTIESNIQRLNNHRIDYMVAYIPDAYDAFQSLGQEPLPHDPESPLAVHNDALVCRGVNESTLKVFNDFVGELPR